jgi:hypothetical protein
MNITERWNQLQYIETRKGKRKLVINGAMFIFQKHGANGKEIWVCDQSRKMCKARIHMTNCEILNAPLEHNHELQIGRVQAYKARAEMRNIAMNTEEKSRMILSRVLSAIPRDVAVTHLPCKENIS